MLAAWDARRAEAYATGDPASLGGLYVAGSRAGARDVRQLGRYAERGLVVAGMQTQVRSVEVVHSAPRRIRMRVSERMVGARAEPAGGAGDPVALPSGGVRHRELVLVRARGDWSVASVRAAG